MNTLIANHRMAGGLFLALVQGDITIEEVDAIVNAANSQLRHAAGVAGSIARRGGPTIQAESDAWVKANGNVSFRKPALTGAGSLKARAIIHAVGPVWGEGDEDAKLYAAVRSALDMAEKEGFGTIAMPAISTGIFGFPVDRAAGVIIGAIQDWNEDRKSAPTHALWGIRLVLFDDKASALFKARLPVR